MTKHGLCKAKPLQTLSILTDHRAGAGAANRSEGFWLAQSWPTAVRGWGWRKASQEKVRGRGWPRAGQYKRGVVAGSVLANRSEGLGLAAGSEGVGAVPGLANRSEG